MTDLRAVHRLVRAVQRRERLAEATALLTTVALPLGLLIAAVGLAAMHRWGQTEPPTLTWLPWLGLVPAPLALLWSWLRPRPLRQSARRLDAHYNLHDLLGGALELTSRPSGPDGGSNLSQAPADPRSADMVALLTADAAAAAPGLDARPVVPLPRPRGRDLLLGWAGALAVLAAMFVPPAPPPVEDSVDIAVDESSGPGTAARPAPDRSLAEPLREDLRQLRGGSDAAAKIAEQMLAVLDQFTRGEIDRAAAFARLEQLEQQLAEAEAELEATQDADPAILSEAMRELAEALEQEEITRPAGEALADGDAERTEKALSEAEDAAAAGEAEMQSLERAMAAAEKALGKAAGENTDTAAQLAEAERRLKRQQQQPAPDPEEQERRLKKQQQRVDELKRQHEREKEAQRKLDQLRRDAQDARGKNGKEQQKRGLEKLRRNTGDAARQAQKSRRLGQARDNMEEAKSFLRKAGNGSEQDKKRRQQMQRFAKAAKGKKGDKNKGPTMLVEGDIGDGDPDMIMESGDGDSQDGDSQGDGEGDSQGDGDGQGDSQGSQDGQGQGDGIGNGTQDPLGDPTAMKVKTRSIKVNPKHGRGATRAETIRTASQEGFADASYRDVYQEYKNFAQSSLDSEAMPAPQRRRVKRYFQMIQPRR
jgi:hypothetical protein